MFTKLGVDDLETLVIRAALPAEAEQPLQGCQELADALDRLEAAGFSSEAVRVLAHALRQREAVWWACVCTVTNTPQDLRESDRLARETAELWVRQQTDSLRREAMMYAEEGGCQTAEAWTGVAAFWSGDSIAALGEPDTPPIPGQAGGAVAAAVTLASVRGEGTRYAWRLKRFLDSGRDIAAGGFGRMQPEPADG